MPTIESPYFWALLVAVLLFTMGGLFSLYEGIHKLIRPEPLSHLWWAIGVLVFGIVLEGASFLAAWKESGRRRGDTPFFDWSRSTGDVNLLVIVFEDLAALLGLGLALIAVALTAITGNPVFDALGTCSIGVLLLAVAIFVASQVRRLIVGFAAGPEAYDDMLAIWDRQGFDVLDLAAVWWGPQRIMVVARVRPRDTKADSVALVHRLDEAEHAICERYPEIEYHFVEPQFDDDEAEGSLNAP